MNAFTPMSVCGSSQKPSTSCANSMRKYESPSLARKIRSIADVTCRCWNAAATLATHAKLFPVRGIKVVTFWVMQLALTGDAAKICGRKGQIENLVDSRRRQAVLYEPVPVGISPLTRAPKTIEQRTGHSFTDIYMELSPYFTRDVCCQQRMGCTIQIGIVRMCTSLSRYTEYVALVVALRPCKKEPPLLGRPRRE